MKESNWKECLLSGAARNVSPDFGRAKSLRETSDERIALISEINEKNANFVFEDYYTSLLELLQAMTFLKGYNVLNHFCLGFYLKEKKNKLYNYISNLILNECSFDTSSVCLIVDKSKSNRSLREDFDNYIRRKLSEKNHLDKLIIRHENSQNEACLQVLDFISWAIFRNYEHSDSRFLDMIKDRIVIKKEVFQKLSGP